MRQFPVKLHKISSICVFILFFCNGMFFETNTPVARAKTASIEVKSYQQSNKKLKLSCKSKKLVKNNSFVLKAQNLKKNQSVSFEMEDTGIAYITSSTSRQCKVKGLGIGKTKVLVSVYENNEKIKTMKCKVIVTPPAVSVRFRTSDITITVNESTSLMSLLSLKPKNTAELPTFTTSDSSLIQIEDGDKIIAKGTGTVTITATISNGKSDVLTVYIVEQKE